MTLEIGQIAPDFILPTDDGTDLCLADRMGRNTVLYFYPKDNTPGCTKQACAFTESMAQFNTLSADIIGVSKDSVAKHKKFKEKYGLSFPLASDEYSDVCERYGVWIEKSMYGKKYMGIERTTFLIDAKGIIRKIWRKVKVDGHRDEIIAALQNL